MAYQIIVMGDSNVRNSYVKDIFDNKLKRETSYVQTNTKEALITAVEKHTKAKNTFIFHCSWMNEIALKAKNKDDEVKDREIAKTIDDIIESMFRAAFEKKDWHFLIMKPIRRKTPAALDQRTAKISEAIQQSFYKEQPPNNLKLTGAPPMEDKHFLNDGVHLTKEGYLILQAHIIDEIYKANQEIECLQEDEDMDHSLNVNKLLSQTSQTQAQTKLLRNTRISVSQTPAQTPARISQRNKRNRDDESESESDSNSSKKTKEDRMDTILARMETLLDIANQKSEENAQNIQINTIEITKNHQTSQFRMNDMDLSIARLKEETDMLDNERMRDTIIVKKLMHGDNIPQKNPELIDLIKAIAKEMTEKITGFEPPIKYIGLAFPIDTTRMDKAPKEVPPFKIQFRNKEDCIEFKVKAIIEAKKPNGSYSGTYLIHPQNPATRVRTMILWEIAKILKEAKCESWVAQSTTRPLLMVKTGQYPRSYGYVQAIQENLNFLSKCDLSEPNKLANRFFRGEVQRLFIILKDDNNKGNPTRS